MSDAYQTFKNDPLRLQGDPCICLFDDDDEPVRICDKHKELHARIAALETQLAERDNAIRAAMANEESLDSERGSTWHILNDALPQPPKETPK